MRRRGEETRNASVGTHAPSRREPEGLISACAALSLLRSTPSRPFSGNKLPLSYQPPAPLPPRRYHPLSYVPSVPLCPSPSLSFFPSSPAVPSVPHCLLPPLRLAFPFLFPRLSLSFFTESGVPCLSRFPSSGSSLCLRFHAFFLACRSVSPPSDPRRSLFARVTHRRGETIRRFPGWHLVSRAAFFLSITLSLSRSLLLSPLRSCLLSSRELLLPMTGRGAHTISGS